MKKFLLFILSFVSIISYAENNEWVEMGEGQWTDPFWKNFNNKPEVRACTIERNINNHGLYRTLPFGDRTSYVYIYASNKNEVHISSYSMVGGSMVRTWVSQRSNKYGTLKDGIITIPSSCFQYDYGNGVYYDCSNPCQIILPEQESNLFMGIVSFDSEINVKPIAELTEDTENSFTEFIENRQLGNSTLLYYGVEQSINKMQQPEFPADLSGVALITFSNSLDQGSLAYRRDLLTSRNYAAFVSNLISSTSIQNIPLEAYSIGLKSEDVLDDDLFALNLQSLASSNDNIFEVSNYNQLKNKLFQIFNKLNHKTTKRDITLQIPILSHDEKYRITFDGTKTNTDVDQSQIWLEGTFDIVNFTLNDVVYHGFTTATNSTSINLEDLGNNMSLFLNDCRDLNGDHLNSDIPDIDIYQYIPSRKIWQTNKIDKIDVSDTKTSALVMLALDNSESLTEEGLSKLKEAVNLFIRYMIHGQDFSGIDENLEDTIETNWDNAEYFNLQGIKVSKPENGIYIQRVGESARKILIQ